jgi:hypothetical protein
VVEVVSLSRFYSLAEELRSAGFTELPDRTSRWKYNGLLLDIVPSGVGELQSSNPWIQEVFARSISRNVDELNKISIPSMLDFIALKFQAFEDRGNRDFIAKDMEDVVAVIDGVSMEMHNNQNQISKDMALYLHSRLAALTIDPDFLNLLPGMLPNSSLARVQRFKSRVAQFLNIAHEKVTTSLT